MLSSSGEQQVRGVVTDAIDDLCLYYKKGYGNRHVVFNRLLNGEKNTRLRQQYLPQPPEQYVEKQLVWPMLSVLGYDVETEVALGDGVQVDFLTTNTPVQILGEVKLPGFHDDARSQMHRYLTSVDGIVGITTDGFYWELVTLDETETDGIRVLTSGDLRGVVAEHATMHDLVDKADRESWDDVSPSSTSEFYNSFHVSTVSDRLAEMS